MGSLQIHNLPCTGIGDKRLHKERLPGLCPEQAANQLRDVQDLIWLDSAASEHSASPHAYICIKARSRAIIHPAGASIDGVYRPGPPLNRLRSWLDDYSPKLQDTAYPFEGGAVGYLSYDFGHSLIDEHAAFPSDCRDIRGEFAIYDTVIVFEAQSNDAWLISPRAEAVAWVKERLSRDVPRLPATVVDWRFDGSRAAFVKKVQRAKDYIRCGDIYQANLAETFSAKLGANQDPLAIYQTIRAANPAPFAAFAKFSDRIIVSSSPERLVSLSADGKASAQPIKGTIASSANLAEDAARQNQLASSPKDRAENLMIVDLLRNDLSRVCAPHSIETPALCQLETFAGLHHLTSTVTGRLRAGHDAFDLLAAIFPGGSITGAPKQRAMEIISELEARPRDAYCGSLGYIGFDGAMDFNILIRTAEIRGDDITYATGAGITLLSDPDAEFDEIMLKAARVTGCALTDMSSK